MAKRMTLAAILSSFVGGIQQGAGAYSGAMEGLRKRQLEEEERARKERAEQRDIDANRRAEDANTRAQEAHDYDQATQPTPEEAKAKREADARSQSIRDYRTMFPSRRAETDKPSDPVKAEKAKTDLAISLERLAQLKASGADPATRVKSTSDVLGALREVIMARVPEVETVQPGYVFLSPDFVAKKWATPLEIDTYRQLEQELVDMATGKDLPQDHSPLWEGQPAPVAGKQEGE